MFKLPKEIIEGINDYKSALGDFLNSRINASRFTGVRVPWGFYSHRGKKVYMSRIRIPAGILTAGQLKAIAQAAKDFGQGIAHITTRQDIQIHGVRIEDTIKVLDYLKDYNLSSRGGGGNTVRNITACPLSGLCADEVFEVADYASSLSEFLLRQENSFNLPRKFKIAFSGCNKDCAGLLLNDVGFLARIKNGKKGFQVFVGGGMGAESILAGPLEEFISEDDIGYCTEAVKQVFYKYGDRKNKHHNRLRFLLKDIGLAKFKELYQKEFQDLKENSYIALRRNSSLQKKSNEGFSNIQLRIPRGDILANEMFLLSELEKDFPGIEFRTSQNQNLYICWVKNQDVEKLFLKLKGILKDFLYPDTLLDVVACKGATTCNLGLCNSPALAEAIEKLVKEKFLNKKVFDKLDIKINGCPNSCGQAPIGKLAFYGMVKRVDNRPVPFYKILIGGKKAGSDTRLAEEIGIIPARALVEFLEEFLKRSEEFIDEKKDMYEFLDGRAKEIIQEILPRFSFVPSYSQDRLFYIDWGREEDFSLAGLGHGECGAGVLDMIEADLTESEIALGQAEKENYSAKNLKKALFLSARALLVVKGKDPKTEEDAFSDFIEKFVKEGIASQKYSALKDAFLSITDNLTLEQKKEKFNYANEFFNHIKHLYKGMDSAFNFPQIEQGKDKDKQKVEESPAKSLDLKGTPCPINYVKVKLFLETLDSGALLEVLLDEGEPIANVPKSLEADGHKILKIEKQGAFYKVLVKKG